MSACGCRMSGPGPLFSGQSRRRFTPEQVVQCHSCRGRLGASKEEDVGSAKVLLAPHLARDGDREHCLLPSPSAWPSRNPKRPRTVACRKSADTIDTSRSRGWRPPNTRMRAVRTGSPEPNHDKIPATSPCLLQLFRGGSIPGYGRNSLWQRNHDCATKRCKFPPAGTQ